MVFKVVAWAILASNSFLGLSQVYRRYTCFCLFVCFILFILAALGLRCCMQAFSSCGERGLLFVEVCRLLIAVASLVAEHGL